MAISEVSRTWESRSHARSRGPEVSPRCHRTKELNEYRIAMFRLRDAFNVFLSSCYTGFRKPSSKAFEYALRLTQRKPGEVLFLDDRKENVEAAIGIGIRGLWVRDPDRVRTDLISAGLKVP